MTQYYLLSTKPGHGDILVWWRPDRCGYTSDLGKAGKYTETEAESIATGHANAVVAVACAVVEPLAIRVVSSAHLLELRRAGRSCLQPGCPERTDGSGDLCTKCIAGETGPSHVAQRGEGLENGYTWCGKIMMEGNGRTWKEHERVLWHSAASGATCNECKTKETAYTAERERLHWHGCENPYCEGCK